MRPRSFVVSFGALVFPLLLAIGCGDQVSARPMNLEIQGLSGRAERLVVLLYPASSGQTCAGVALATVQGMMAPYSASWTRISMAERKFEFPAVEEDRVTIVAFSEDASGAAIQQACVVLDFLQLESPDVTLTLSRRE